MPTTFGSGTFGSDTFGGTVAPPPPPPPPPPTSAQRPLFPDLVAEIAFNANPLSSYLRLLFTINASADSWLYYDLIDQPDYVVQAGDWLEYDVYWEWNDQKIAVDFTAVDALGAEIRLKDTGVTDQNGLAPSPATDLNARCVGVWYHRKFPISTSGLPIIGATIKSWDVACEANGFNTYDGRIRDIQITDGAGTVRRNVWRQVQPMPTLVKHRESPVGNDSTPTTAPVAEGAVTVPVVDTSGFPASGEAIKGGTGGEVFTYTSATGASLTGCLRTPAMASGTNVYETTLGAVLVAKREFETPVFVNVTPWLLEAHPRCGRKGMLDRADPGVNTVVLANEDRRFDTENTGSPYYPNVKGGRRMRVRVWRYYERAKGDGPVALYRLNETAGTAITDEMKWSPGTYSGTLTPGGGMVVGDSDSALIFNGSNRYANIPHTSFLNVGDTFSVEALLARAANGVLHTIASKGTNGFLFTIEADNTLAIAKTGVGIIAKSTTTITDTNAHHVVVTKSGATVKIYIDGVDRTGTVTNQTIANTSTAMQIGRNVATSSGYFNGSLQLVALYPRALTAEEVDAHFDKMLFGYWGDLFDGHIEDWPVNWKGRLPEVTLTVNDAFASLEKARISGYRPLEYSGSRINWVLDEAIFPGGRAIDPGRSLMEESSELSGTLLDNDSALDQLLAVAESEVGIFFINGSGTAVFHDRMRRVLASSVLGTFTSDPTNVSPGSLLALDITPSESVLDVLNDVRLRPIAAETDGVAEDLTSQLENGLQPLARTVWLTSVPECQSQAEWLIGLYGELKLRFDEIRLDPKRDLNGLVPQILSRQISDRIRVVYRMPSGQPGAVDTAGPIVTRECFIESIEHDIVTRNGQWSWETRYSLSAAETQAFWILGDAAQSLLGSTTVLGY